MKRGLYILIFTMLVLFTGVSAQSYDVNIVGPALIKIHGSSNINKFMLSYTRDIVRQRKLTLAKVESNRQTISGSNKIALEVGAFTSSHKMITSDFYKMLQKDKYPFINIEISRLIINPSNPLTPNVMAVITLAGSKRIEILPVVIVKKPNNQIQLSSLHKLSLKNYNLSPPKKLMGMVSVSDEVFIEITLIAQYR